MKPDDLIKEFIPIEIESQESINTSQNDWTRSWRTDARNRAMSSDKYRYHTHSQQAKTLKRYLFEDCVVAYIKDIFGCMFILKGKRKHFTFVVKDKNLYFGGMGYNLMDITELQALKMIEKIKEKREESSGTFEIINKEEFQRMKNKILIDTLAK